MSSARNARQRICCTRPPNSSPRPPSTQRALSLCQGLGVGLSLAQGILSDPDSSALATALLLIGNTRSAEVADAVRQALSDKEWSVRAAAIRVVATHPYPVFRSDLSALLDDKKDAVRLHAAAAHLRLERRAGESRSGSRAHH